MRKSGWIVLAAVVALAGIVALAPVVVGQVRRQDERVWRSGALRLPFGETGRIGAAVRDVEDADVRNSGLEARAGAVIERVEADGPAARAGIKAGDIVVEFDGERVRTARQFARLVSETPERTVRATLVRGTATETVEVTPEAGPPLGMSPERVRDMIGSLGEFDFEIEDYTDFGGGRRRLGVGVQALTPQLADYFGVTDGVLVTSVTDGSLASRAGVKAGDVITSINGRPVTRRSDLVRILRDAEPGQEVSVGVTRDRKSMTLSAPMEEPPTRRPAATRGNPV